MSYSEQLVDPSYVVPVYSAVSTVVSTHNSVGLRFSNVIVAPMDSQEWEDYWYGLIIVPAVLIGVVLLAEFAFCCMPCCRCRCRVDRQNRKIGFVLFVLVSIGAIICWFFCFAVNGELTASADKTKEGITMILTQAEKWSNVTVEVLNFMTQTNYALLLIKESACTPEIKDIIQNDNFVNYINQANASLQSADAIISDMMKSLDDIDTAPSAAYEPREIVIYVFTAFMLFLTVFLLITSVVVFVDLGSPKRRELKRSCAKAAFLCVVIIGLLLILITVLVSAVVQAGSVAGSDICINPDQTLQTLSAQVLESPHLALSTQLNGSVPLCGLLSGEAPPSTLSRDFPNYKLLQYLCFYQTCRGTSEIAVLLDYLDAGVKGAGTAIESALEKVESKYPECSNALKLVNNTLTQNLYTAITAVVAAFQCPSVNTIYQQLYHESLCQGFVPNAVKVWQSFFTGAFLLLLAVILFQMYHLGEGIDAQLDKANQFVQQQMYETTSNNFDADPNDTINQQQGSLNTVPQQNPKDQIPMATAVEISGVDPKLKSETSAHVAQI